MFLRIALLLLLFITASGSLPALAQDDIQEHRSCALCGMDRKAYGYSRMLVQYKDAGAVGVCSLHCAVSDLEKNLIRPVKSILVADRDSRQLIVAEKAFWVLGGSKRGVMTNRPKWAFATQQAAQKFIDAHGGALATWKDALAAAQRDAGVKEREILTDSSI